MCACIVHILKKIGVRRGVKQGSVHGPELFRQLTGYPNWLHDACHAVIYANNTVLTLSDKTTETMEINN